MIERAEKKLYLDRMVTRDGMAANGPDADTELDGNRLMSTLKFGCNAVFGQASEQQILPSRAEIEIITDRSRADDYSSGQLQGSSESNASDFLATKEFTKTTDFGGIDFKKIRDEYGKKKFMNMAEITNQWKRQRKSRIFLVESKGSGYGAPVPILASNNYDLETGEQSVFDRELKGRVQLQKKVKKKAFLEHQDFCQECGDGGELLIWYVLRRVLFSRNRFACL